MKSFTLDELGSCLASVNISAGDLVMLHSTLLGLGQLAEHRVADFAPAIVSYLRKYLGPKGTLVVPTFNFGFCKGIAYDRQKTPSENMGLISEIVRCLPSAVRSRHPMQSIAAIGPLASKICDPDTSSAFDEQGSFGVLIDLNAKLLLLGTSFQAASILHYAEQEVGVPYRYWKEFSGTYVNHGQKKKKKYRMYVRDLNLNPMLMMTKVEKELIKRNQLRQRSLGGGLVRSCSFKDLIETSIDCLKRDPYCLVANSGSLTI